MRTAPLYPAALKKGDRVFVTAPSSGVAESCWPRLDLVLQHLRDQGFVVEEGMCLRQQHQNASAAAEVRAAELMGALLRDDIAAVFPPWGGELAIELLALLDWERLAQTKPKWLLGFSDLSTLMLPLLLRSGWASAVGPNLMDLSPAQADPLTLGALDLLSVGVGGSVEQRSSTLWQKEYDDFAVCPAAAFRLTEPTRWRTLDGADEARASGRVLGGCLDTLMHLVGTPYGDVPAWQRALSPVRSMLFLENSDLPPTDVVRALSQMRYAGWFQHLSALVVGRSGRRQALRPTELDEEQAIRQSLAGLGCPVLLDADFGHVPPQLTLLQGSQGQLFYEAGRGRLIQTLA